jgi:hypothetical protein
VFLKKILEYADTPFYKSIGSEAFWTAGSEGKCSGQFAWCGQQGEFRKSDLNWAPGALASKESDGCLFLSRTHNDSLLDKANCSTTKKFVCMFKETDQYQENHVERECRKMQRIEFGKMAQNK